MSNININTTESGGKARANSASHRDFSSSSAHFMLKSKIVKKERSQSEAAELHTGNFTLCNPKEQDMVASADVYSWKLKKSGEGVVYAVYCIHVALKSGYKWLVEKRYSQFRDLRREIKQVLPDAEQMEFPRKRLLFNLSHTILRQRQAVLNSYLAQLADLRPQPMELAIFLEVESNLGNLDHSGGQHVLIDRVMSAGGDRGTSAVPAGASAGGRDGGALQRSKTTNEASSQEKSTSATPDSKGKAKGWGWGGGWVSAGGGGGRDSTAKADTTSISPASKLPQAQTGGAHDESERAVDVASNKSHAASIRKSQSMQMLGTPSVSIKDFDLLKVLGKGSFGKVFLVRPGQHAPHLNNTSAAGRSSNGNGPTVYAMKVLRKSEVVRRHQVEHTLTERSILATVKHRNILALRFAFQTEQKLYMVLDYCPGGELFFHLKKLRRFTEGMTRFYTAQICLAVAHLHKNLIIYRDLKPENLLLDRAGNVKITDFGLSKRVSSYDFQPGSIEASTATFCGTPEYLSPEMIVHRRSGSGYGREVDWWSLGIVCFELLTGWPPFFDRDFTQMCEKILYKPLHFPVKKYNMTKDAEDLIRGLLTRDYNKRMYFERDPSKDKHHQSRSTSAAKSSAGRADNGVADDASDGSPASSPRNESSTVAAAAAAASSINNTTADSHSSNSGASSIAKSFINFAMGGNRGSGAAGTGASGVSGRNSRGLTVKKSKGGGLSKRNVQEHPFFADLDWAAMERGELIPPFIPPMSRDLTDTRNFDREFTKLAVKDSIVPAAAMAELKKKKKDKDAFKKFSFMEEPSTSAASAAGSDTFTGAAAAVAPGSGGQLAVGTTMVVGGGGSATSASGGGGGGAALVVDSAGGMSSTPDRHSSHLQQQHYRAAATSAAAATGEQHHRDRDQRQEQQEEHFTMRRKSSGRSAQLAQAAQEAHGVHQYLDSVHLERVRSSSWGSRGAGGGVGGGLERTRSFSSHGSPLSPSTTTTTTTAAGTTASAGGFAGPLGTGRSLSQNYIPTISRGVLFGSTAYALSRHSSADEGRAGSGTGAGGLGGFLHVFTGTHGPAKTPTSSEGGTDAAAESRRSRSKTATSTAFTSSGGGGTTSAGNSRNRSKTTAVAASKDGSGGAASTSSSTTKDRGSLSTRNSAPGSSSLFDRHSTKP